MDQRRDRAAEQRVQMRRQLRRVMAETQQQLIDAEISATRHRLWLNATRRSRLGADLLDPSFLTVADRLTLTRAVIHAARNASGITAVDIQRVNAQAGTLVMEDSGGFSQEFIDYFRSLTDNDSTACVLAWRSGQPVMVADVRHDPIFANPSTKEAMLAARSGAVRSYPLLSRTGAVTGVLSLHAAQSAHLTGESDMIARCAIEALRLLPRTVISRSA